MDQLDLDVGTKTERKRGRPRKWESEGERRAAENTKRQKRGKQRRDSIAEDPELRRRLAVQARLAALAAPVIELHVTDEDLKSLAQDFPNTAEALQYTRDVLSGKQLACEWVRLACERHERDLGRMGDEDFPYIFNAQRAERVLRAVQMFREIRGPRAGKRFRFAPWQKFIIGSVFGWVNPKGARRFRYVFVAVPRGNGKSSMAAPLGLYMLALDGEGGAEVYAAAVTRDQARIVFSAAHHMARTDPVFRNKYGIELNAHAILQTQAARSSRPCRATRRRSTG